MVPYVQKKKKHSQRERNKQKKSKKATTLHHAANCGDLDKLLHLLCKGVYINAQDVSGDTALHKAVIIGDFECARLLVNEGADVNIPRRDGTTALHLAAALDLQKFIAYFIEHGAYVDAEAHDNVTPLHWAVSKSNPESVKLLLKHGASVNAVTRSGKTPLHIALSKSEECIGVLTKRGADMFLKDGLGISSLEIASELGLYWFKKMLPEKFDISATDGTTALHITSKCVNVLCLRYMIESGCNVNVENNDGDTPLHFACFRGKCLSGLLRIPVQVPATPHIELLVKAGADIEKKNKLGLAPVHICAMYGSLVSLDHLHKFGCDLNLRGGNKNFTPLHFACASGHLRCIEFLLEKGADKTSADADNNTALMVAAKNCHFSCVKFLLQEDVPLWVT